MLKFAAASGNSARTPCAVLAVDACAYSFFLFDRSVTGVTDVSPFHLYIRHSTSIWRQDAHVVIARMVTAIARTRPLRNLTAIRLRRFRRGKRFTGPNAGICTKESPSQRRWNERCAVLVPLERRHDQMYALCA